ncbi:hypothetical protein OROMI_020108 [Orobanche minor]
MRKVDPEVSALLTVIHLLSISIHSKGRVVPILAVLPLTPTVDSCHLTEELKRSTHARLRLIVEAPPLHLSTAGQNFGKRCR